MIFKKPKKMTSNFFDSYIFIQQFQWISSEFIFNFRLSSRKSLSQQKQAKKITNFTIKFHPKNQTHFTNLD